MTANTWTFELPSEADQLSDYELADIRGIIEARIEQAIRREVRLRRRASAGEGGHP